MAADETDPTAVNLELAANKGKVTSIGRAELDGDTLRLAFASSPKAPRPEKAVSGRGLGYIEFRRVTEAKPKDK